jgi:galactose mutarotase-like enzyme
MVTLENEFLKVSVSSEGAELLSIFNKKSNIEYLWQADPEVWGWHAPNLFPVVGRCINNQILIDGKTFSMEKHGFARTSHFKRVESTDIHAKFSLNYSQATLAVYPYKFEFQVLYDLFDDFIRVSYKVINKDDNSIYFSLGAHPAFNVPLYSNDVYEDYFIELEREEQLERHTISANGFFTGKPEPFPINGKRIYLNKDVFNQDAIVFKGLKSRKVSLKSKNHSGYITISYPHMDYLGIWAKPGAAFVCIEPWLGCADTEGKIIDIKYKEGMQELEHGHVFETDFAIEVHE